MSLAYSSDSEGWVESRKHELASRLRELVAMYKDATDSEPGERPYVEVDERGVRLRQITHLGEEHQASIAKKAAQIYRDVMLRPASKTA